MTMLKGIPRILPPKLLYVLAQMGHGDELVLADANFPSESIAACTPAGIIRCDGCGIPELLEAILSLFPLEPTVAPCYLMQMMPEHVEAGWTTPIWDSYRKLAALAKGKEVEFAEVERFAFYEQAKKAYVVVATGETALYGNLILKKGVMSPDGKEV